VTGSHATEIHVTQSLSVWIVSLCQKVPLSFETRAYRFGEFRYARESLVDGDDECEFHAIRVESNDGNFVDGRVANVGNRDFVESVVAEVFREKECQLGREIVEDRDSRCFPEEFVGRRRANRISNSRFVVDYARETLANVVETRADIGTRIARDFVCDVREIVEIEIHFVFPFRFDRLSIDETNYRAIELESKGEKVSFLEVFGMVFGNAKCMPKVVVFEIK